jgi:hypothetical protein
LGCWVWIVFAQVSFVCCGMITLLFSIWWRMLTSTFFPSIWHYGIFKLYYPKLFVLKFPPFESLVVQLYFTYMFFRWTIHTNKNLPSS